MKTFFDKTKFNFSKIFEDNWKIIHDEYQSIQANLILWPEKELHNNNWEVFGLFNYPHGEAIVENCILCPATTKLIKENFQRFGAAGFSKLHANSTIKPHYGYNGNYLRMHLGLDVPDGDVCIKVEEDVYCWKNGEVVVFDDRLCHEAWNKTNQDRVVLIVDFIP